MCNRECDWITGLIASHSMSDVDQFIILSQKEASHNAATCIFIQNTCFAPISQEVTFILLNLVIIVNES